MTIDNTLIELIQKTPYLNPTDKTFLLQTAPQMQPLEKMRLRSSLMAGQLPAILQSLQIAKASFFEKEKAQNPQKSNNLLTKISSVFHQNPEPRIISKSILTDTKILGSSIPQAIKDQNPKPLINLNDFYHPAQLSLLNNKHINFGLNINSQQILHGFLNKLTNVFDSIENINLKRNYFMNFMQSPLFSSYINTAVTALRHSELEPRNIALNLLNQINPNYLNNKQFQISSLICNHLRNLAAI
jgi:hypothetical protein